MLGTVAFNVKGSKTKVENETITITPKPAWIGCQMVDRGLPVILIE